MILVISGEGPSDLGACSNSFGLCSDSSFAIGPMTVILDQIIESQMGYSIRNFPEHIYFISKTALGEYAKKLPNRLQPTRSKKKSEETGYYFNNAFALGKYALECEQNANDQAIAVLFRDADGTNSAPAMLWQTKWDSINNGFRGSRFQRGVAMLPKPTSEAWLLCAAHKVPYQNCEQLEDLPGNQKSLDHPKNKLESAFGHRKTADELCEWIENITFDFRRAESMPSFKAFLDALECAVNNLMAKEVVS